MVTAVAPISSVIEVVEVSNELVDSVTFVISSDEVSTDIPVLVSPLVDPDADTVS